MTAVSPFIQHLWDVCSGDEICVQVYGARVDMISFQTQVTAALGNHASILTGTPLIETLEAIYTSISDTITHTPLWDMFYLQLLRKYDLCAHNELYDENSGECLCQPGRTCIDEVYNTRQNLASQIILYIILGIFILLLMVSTFKQAGTEQKLPKVRR